jgi:hypothetical protein
MIFLFFNKMNDQIYFKKSLTKIEWMKYFFCWESYCMMTGGTFARLHELGHHVVD